MSKTTCDFFFDNNPNKVYFSGQTLSGRIILTLYEPESLRGICTEIYGAANSSWIEGRNYVYNGEAFYLNEKNYVMGTGTEDLTIPAGIHTFNFYCKLPFDLPTSVDGTDHSNIASIKYTVGLSLERPLWQNKKFEKVITVIRPLNLNDDPKYCEHYLSDDFRKYFSYCGACFCIYSDPLEIFARLPHTAYVPKQTIPLDITVENNSHIRVWWFVIKLNKVITLYVDKTRHPKDLHRIVKEELFKERRPGCGSKTSKDLKINIPVPATLPTDESSNVVETSYEISIKAYVICCHKNPEFNIPITIGTTALASSNNEEAKFNYLEDYTAPPVRSTSRCSRWIRSIF